MSLLGFDAVGRLAIAQLPRGSATNTIFVASPAAVTLAGRAASFQSALTQITAALVYAGGSAGARIGLLGAQNSWLTAGTAVLYSFGAFAARGDFVAAGNSITTAGTMQAAGRAHTVSGQSSAFLGAMTGQKTSYQLVGYDVGYGRGFEAWYPLGVGTIDWSSSTDPEQAWLPAPAVADHWLGVSASSISWNALSPSAPPWTGE
ncbi:hypothetical protein [Bradyrhizobium sp. HKCCYLS2033]|uniref:hypothetical protein n=1 Tax=Bradyrhizobium TaxID=374 RepID=UPI003EB7040B